jgi:hypothetical protein
MKYGVVGMWGWRINPVEMNDLAVCGVTMACYKRSHWQREGKQG